MQARQMENFNALFFPLENYLDCIGGAGWH